MGYASWLLIFAPVAAALGWWLHAPATWVFAAAALAIIPLSAQLGRATEDLAAHTSATLGGLLNATLGNAAELIITVMALRAGLIDLVKASIIGSIIGNLLLVLGASLFAGGMKHRALRFGVQAAAEAASMMTLSVAALVIPAVLLLTHPHRRVLPLDVSVVVAAVLIVTYCAGLFFSLRTHAALVTARGEGEVPRRSARQAGIALLLATIGIALMSELLVGATEEAAAALGLSQMFVGIIVVPIVGNAAEHTSALWMAVRNKADLAFAITIGSCTQIALFVAPVLVFLALALGRRMDFVFAPLEVVAVAAAVAIVNVVAHDGESNWFEGAQLLAVYLILAAAFFYY